ncbi:DUF6233 domain-containing protein [Streptomyces sp. NPDC101209]|uniref:DUF6233 domain-containing protein n=1 Tax=Streptomyces sp. NPDC101209 TaxID=3366129 RepID=UPI00380A0E8B
MQTAVASRVVCDACLHASAHGRCARMRRRITYPIIGPRPSLSHLQKVRAHPPGPARIVACSRSVQVSSCFGTKRSSLKRAKNCPTFNRRGSPEYVVGDCWSVGRRSRSIGRDQARRALAEGVKACPQCQPDATLGMLAVRPGLQPQPWLGSAG